MLKTPTTYQQQIEKLKEHNCVVADEEFCTSVLTRISYYRLSAYFLPFRKADGKYCEGTRFENVYALYEFDRKMRNIVFSAIEETEVSIRAYFSYYHSHKYGSDGYTDEHNYNNRHDHAKFMKRLNDEIVSNKRVLYVQHHLTKYQGQFPLWVAMELFTFGMLSYWIPRYLGISIAEIVPSSPYPCANLRPARSCFSLRHGFHGEFRAGMGGQCESDHHELLRHGLELERGRMCAYTFRFGLYHHGANRNNAA